MNHQASKILSPAEAPDKLLVLLAGQSNMAGRGYAGPDDLTVIPRLLMIRPDFKWQPAVEPITKDRPFVGTFLASGEKIVSADPFETFPPQGDQKVVGVGLGRIFGRLPTEANPGRTVGLIPCAVGGTSIAAWMPGGIDDHDPENHPYDVAVQKAREAQKSGQIVAVLLFDVDRSVVTRHLWYIFASGELSEESICAKQFAQVADNGKTYQLNSTVLRRSLPLDTG